jgi:hypothetical protein
MMYNVQKINNFIYNFLTNVYTRRIFVVTRYIYLFYLFGNNRISFMLQFSKPMLDLWIRNYSPLCVLSLQPHPAKDAL